MSWGIKAAGSKDNVKALIAAQDYIPPVVKQIIAEQVDSCKLDPQWNGDKFAYDVLVETHGHIDNITCDIHVNVTRVASGLRTAPPSEGVPEGAKVPHNDA